MHDTLQARQAHIPATMPAIIETSTLTSKGQITLPKPIRQALGVDSGQKVLFRLNDDGQITLSRADASHEDPAILGFLSMLENDIHQGRHIHDLPPSLQTALRAALLDGKPLDLNDDIDGDVAL